MTRNGLSRTLQMLNAEWAELSTSPLPTPWLLAHDGFEEGDTLGDIPRRVRERPDATLLALLTLHRGGDALAARAVIQAMVPKMVLMAGRDPESSFDDYLGALWLRIVTYPLERRRRAIAANLALDTLKSVTATARAPRPAGLVWEPVDPLDDAAPVLAAGVRLGVIDARTSRTLATVYLAGRTSAAAGQVLGVSADAVRWRCSKGVRALRAARDELREAVAG
ncbi:MAG: hypothetical protein QM708_08790 [Propioniciclava sp.]|uniref:hypothetical protein n=1 Tax=Propioniciclava sp. TaxID=2038686 RepID=UPI0039E44BA3